MQMTSNEIITKYRQSDNHKEKIKILAQLNGCDKAEIETILKGAGYMKLFQGTRDLSVSLDRIIKLRAEGKTQTQIAKLLNTEQTYISKLLRENAPEENPERPVKNSEKTKKEVSEAPKAKLEIDGKEILPPEEKEVIFEKPEEVVKSPASEPIVDKQVYIGTNNPSPSVASYVEQVKAQFTPEFLNAVRADYEKVNSRNDSADALAYTIGEAVWRPRYNEEPIKADNVNHPSHYGGANNLYEAIKVIDEWNLGFDLGNTVKYISRAGKKDGNSEIQDLEKAKFYLEHRIEKLRGSAGNANS